MYSTSPLLGGEAGDAVYPRHVINGRPPADPLTFEPRPRTGDRVRLRVINAGSDTAYRFAVGHRMTVTHADGYPVVPVQVDAFVIGMGERYDITVNVQSGAWPRPGWHKAVGAGFLVLGAAIAVLNDIMLLGAASTLLPGGRSEPYLILGVGIAGYSTVVVRMVRSRTLTPG